MTSGNDKKPLPEGLASFARYLKETRDPDAARQRARELLRGERFSVVQEALELDEEDGDGSPPAA